MILYLIFFGSVFMGLKLLLEVINREPLQKIAYKYGIKKNFVTFIAKFIQLSPIRERELQQKLSDAELPFQAKEYIAAGYVKTLPLIILAVFLFTNRNLLQGFIFLLVAYLVNNRHIKQLNKKLQQIEREKTEELPEFMSYVTNSLKTDKDMIKIIESYNPYANPALRSELIRLVAELKTGNIDEALLSFDLRMNISHLSNFLSAIRATMAGEIQDNALESITLDMDDYENEIAKKRAAEIPGKISKATIIVICAMIGYDLFVLFYSVYLGVNNIV